MDEQAMPDASLREPAREWATGIEGQRKADLGDGTYLNPILPGDHPDPTILKDGDDYYMTFSSFNSYPGIVIWHSKDLVNWNPVGPALKKNIGTVWALISASTRIATTSTFRYWSPTGPSRRT